MKKKETLAIVSCSNTDFSSHLAALFVSILENWKNKEIDLQFYVVDDDIDGWSKQLLMSTLRKYEAPLDFLSIDKKIFKNVVTSNRIPQSAYYRIVIPELICHKGIDKVLYLDCDMIALTDISALNKVNLEDCALAAVEDAGFHNRFQKMKVQTNSNLYFNSGMMYINVEKWIEDNITEQVLTFIEKYPSILKYHDQDALNAILHDQWHQLHPKWNAQRYILAKERKHPYLQGEKEYRETRANPAIIHYTGRKKPWHSDYDLPLKRFYCKYANMTAFSKLERIQYYY